MAYQKRLGISSRQDQIINLVRDQGYASIEMMAEKFDVAQQTVRRDIIYLSEKGLLQRHGARARSPTNSTLDSSGDVDWSPRSKRGSRKVGKVPQWVWATLYDDRYDTCCVL